MSHREVVAEKTFRDALRVTKDLTAHTQLAREHRIVLNNIRTRAEQTFQETLKQSPGEEQEIFSRWERDRQECLSQKQHEEKGGEGEKKGGQQPGRDQKNGRESMTQKRECVAHSVPSAHNRRNWASDIPAIKCSEDDTLTDASRSGEIGPSPTRPPPPDRKASLSPPHLTQNNGTSVAPFCRQMGRKKDEVAARRSEERRRAEEKATKMTEEARLAEEARRSNQKAAGSMVEEEARQVEVEWAEDRAKRILSRLHSRCAPSMGVPSFRKGVALNTRPSPSNSPEHCPASTLKRGDRATEGGDRPREVEGRKPSPFDRGQENSTGQPSRLDWGICGGPPSVFSESSRAPDRPDSRRKAASGGYKRKVSRSLRQPSPRFKLLREKERYDAQVCHIQPSRIAKPTQRAVSRLTLDRESKGFSEPGDDVKSLQDWSTAISVARRHREASGDSAFEYITASMEWKETDRKERLQRIIPEKTRQSGGTVDLPKRAEVNEVRETSGVCDAEGGSGVAGSTADQTESVQTGWNDVRHSDLSLGWYADLRVFPFHLTPLRIFSALFASLARLTAIPYFVQH